MVDWISKLMKAQRLLDEASIIVDSIMAEAQLRQVSPVVSPKFLVVDYIEVRWKSKRSAQVKFFFGPSVFSIALPYKLALLVEVLVKPSKLGCHSDGLSPFQSRDHIAGILSKLTGTVTSVHAFDNLVYRLSLKLSDNKLGSVLESRRGDGVRLMLRQPLRDQTFDPSAR